MTIKHAVIHWLHRHALSPKFIASTDMHLGFCLQFTEQSPTSTKAQSQS